MRAAVDTCGRSTGACKRRGAPVGNRSVWMDTCHVAHVALLVRSLGVFLWFSCTVDHLLIKNIEALLTRSQRDAGCTNMRHWQLTLLRSHAALELGLLVA